MRKGVVFGVLLVVFLVISIPTIFAPTEEMIFCSGTISESYTMDYGYTCSSDGITIDTEGVVFDCDDNIFSGSGSETGILVTADNVEIKNCDISDFKYGVFFDHVNNGIVSESTFSRNGQALGNGNGIRIRGGSGHQVYNNLFEDNHYGISLSDYTEEIEIYENEIYNSLNKNIYSAYTNDINIYDNYISGDNTDYIVGAFFVNCVDCEFNNNNISAVDFAVDISSNSDGLIFNDNTISDATTAVEIISSNTIIFEGNIISNAETGVDMNSVTDATISDNVLVEGIEGYGFIFQSSEITEFDYNQIYSAGWGIKSSLTDFTSFVSNVITGELLGIKWYYSAAEDISSNYFCGSGDYDFFCSETLLYSTSDSNLVTSGSGNFMDTINYCQTDDTYDTDCEIEFDHSYDGDTFQLDANLDCSASAFEIAVNISADDFVFDCQGYSIVGYPGDPTLNTGVAIFGDDVIVQNCVLEDFSIGLYTLSEGNGETKVINSEVLNSDNYGIMRIDGDFYLSNVLVSSASTALHNLYIQDGDDVVINNNILCSSADNDLAFGAFSGDLTFSSNYLDINKIVGAPSNLDNSNVLDCSDAPTTLGLEIPNLFPSELSSTNTCIEANACDDSLDNDADGLIDCADSDCNLKSCSSTYGYACIEGACIEVVLEEAQQATVQIETAYIGYLWSYTDIFSWLNSATVYHEVGVCDDICGSYSQTCLFADAGRSLCSDEDSEKCTCA